jgi:hypothetical protein
MHMAKLSISAWALHNLSLAIAYGGPVFAKAALHPAAKEIVSDKERGKLLLTAWTKFTPVDVAAHLTFTATWLYGRKVLKSRRLSHETAALVTLKDLLIGGALITGVANAIVGKAFARRFPQGVPVGPNGEIDPKSKEALKFKQYFKVMGPLNRALVAGAIAVGPAITVSVVRSMKRGMIARLLTSR